MQKKQMLFKTKGMNQDLSVSAFNPEFSFENMNLRLSTNEHNTLMSWVNEKGTLRISTTIDLAPWMTGEEWEAAHPGESKFSDILAGIPIGTAIINSQLIIFTTDSDAESKRDYIYVLWEGETENSMKGNLVFNGDINFDVKYPIETLPSYESNHIQKVYWVDGKNMPRIINITASKAEMKKWSETVGNPHLFDFTPSLDLKEEVTVEQIPSGGRFNSGTIQYCFTYINKYGQQSNIVYTSPIYYISPFSRGGAPNEIVSTSFKITIKNADRDFNYIRVYAIYRSSLDSPEVYRLYDYRVGDEVEITDTYLEKISVDPNELLYVGGRELVAKTLAAKDNTLFLGNLTESMGSILKMQDYFDSLRTDPEGTPIISFNRNNSKKTVLLNNAYGSVYSYKNEMVENKRSISTFKCGNTYRFGFQLQKYNGEWTDPIFIEDATNEIFPRTNVFNQHAHLVSASGTINIAALNSYLEDYDESIDTALYKNIRPIIVYPKASERGVICQGVLNPTVFFLDERKDNAPFAQSSWIFRPYVDEGEAVAAESEERRRIKESIRVVISSDDYDPSAVGVSPETATFGANAIILKTPTPLTKAEIQYTRNNVTSPWKSQIVVIQFLGFVELRVSDNNYWYLLINNDVWPAAGTIRDQDNEEWHCAYAGEVITSNYAITFSSLLQTFEGMFYLPIQEGVVSSGDTMTLTARSNTEMYTVTYTATIAASLDPNNSVANIVVPPVTSRRCFKHYEGPLPVSTNDLEFDSDIMNLNTPFSTYTTEGRVTILGGTISEEIKYTNNLQFWVDQSILTMCSPDIEWDGSVQTYKNGNLKLRIVGAVPITAGEGSYDELYHHKEVSPHEGSETIAESDQRYLLKNDKYDYYVNNNLISTSSLMTAFKNMYALRTLPPTIMWLKNYSYYKTPYANYTEATETLTSYKANALLYSFNTEYLDSKDFVNFDINYNMVLEDNSENIAIFNMGKQRTSDTKDIWYNGNANKVYAATCHQQRESSGYFTDANYTWPISYKACTHAAIALKALGESSDIPILPKAEIGHGGSARYLGGYTNPESGSDIAYWGDTMRFSQETINITDLFTYSEGLGGRHIPFSFLWLGELYQDVDPDTIFGGTSREAVRTNRWYPCGEAVSLTDNNNQLVSEVTLDWLDGDAYYQRYDCLKAYPFIEDREDTNNFKEILSFMCETYTNIDGRYDNNRGFTNIENVTPQNFNLLNTAYSQLDNFRSFMITYDEETPVLKYPNFIWYSKTKESGADVDLFTNITLASVLELDGNKGEINSLQKFNNQIIAFQDEGISQILFNESAQIASTAGVPIELANSGKVDGKRYLSETVGCSNKWSIANTPSGIYFMDSIGKDIYLFNGQLSNISSKLGFNTWAKNNIPGSNIDWDPADFNNFVAHYDKINQDVLFINKDRALALSEKVGAFTSFYDYGKVPFFCNMNSGGVWIAKDKVDNECKLWKHQAGNYGSFFGVNRPYWMTLVGNPDPQIDKIFTNLEFRAYSDMSSPGDNQLPFTYLETWNEYQHGYTNLERKNGTDIYKHHTADGISNLAKKFRIWRCDIPRDNALYDFEGDSARGIYRTGRHPNDRMMNPWLYLKLFHQEAGHNQILDRTEIHDIVMDYFE